MADELFFPLKPINNFFTISNPVTSDFVPSGIILFSMAEFSEFSEADTHGFFELVMHTLYGADEL